MDDDWVKCGDAYGELKRRFASQNPLTIRKAIIGMIKAGELPVIADRYTETALVFVTRDHVSKSHDPWGDHEAGNSPPFDFWRYGMAIEPKADQSFEVSVFGNELGRIALQLPYRFFKYRYELDQSPAALHQIAYDVRFSRPHLDALFADRRWSNVWPNRAESKRPGRKKQWLWDSVKAALTRDFAEKPELLEAHPAAIVSIMKDHFNDLQPQGGHPDESDLYEYAQRVIGQIQMIETAP